MSPYLISCTALFIFFVLSLAFGLKYSAVKNADPTNTSAQHGWLAGLIIFILLGFVSLVTVVVQLATAKPTTKYS